MIYVIVIYALNHINKRIFLIYYDNILLILKEYETFIKISAAYFTQINFNTLNI